MSQLEKEWNKIMLKLLRKGKSITVHLSAQIANQDEVLVFFIYKNFGLVKL